MAECDSASADCYNGQDGPYAWSITLDAAQVAEVANGLEDGSLDFGYTWDQDTPPFGSQAAGYTLQYVNVGPATLSVFTPEPGTVLFCLSGIAGIFFLRRFRKA